MISPLAKRFPRDLVHNLGKYLGIFLLMTLAIGLVTGFLAAAASIMQMAGTMRDDYNIEDARLSIPYKLTSSQVEDVQEKDCTLYENFCINASAEISKATEDGGSETAQVKIRAYQVRTKVDLAAYAQGRAPEAADEISLDRVFCADNGIVLGSTVNVAGKAMKVVGIMTLPDYQASFHPHVFVITTVVPLVLLVGVNWRGLVKSMNHTPLQFLRHELTESAQERAVDLPEAWSFPLRFRVRVLLQGLSNFIILFVGIVFASLLLIFGLCMLPTMDHYADGLRDSLVANHHYVTSEPVELEGSEEEVEAWAAQHKLDVAEPGSLSVQEEDSLKEAAKRIKSKDHAVNTAENDATVLAQAEKYAVISVLVDRPLGGQEEVTVYGIQDGSAYWDLPLGEDQVLLGSGLADKCGLSAGGIVTLDEKYSGWSFDIRPTNVMGGEGCMDIYMPLEKFNRLFGNNEDYFNAWASNEPLNIDSWLLSSHTTPEDMDKIGAQMEDSMGDMMDMLLYVAVAIYLVLMYLLTKTVLDRNARSISYMKVLGYRNGEVNKLYLHAVTAAVVVSLLVSIPILLGLIGLLLKVAFAGYSGNIVAYTPPSLLAETVLMGLASYVVVLVLHTFRIRRIPLALALKTQE